jgi:hypothetical protein
MSEVIHTVLLADAGPKKGKHFFLFFNILRNIGLKEKPARVVAIALSGAVAAGILTFAQALLSITATSP